MSELNWVYSMIPLIKSFIPTKQVLMPKLEEVLYSGYIAQGEVVEQFESKLNEYFNTDYCVTVNSGSAALHVALELIGVRPGDEVISTPITAEPTNTVIAQTGAKIVWADIDLNTGNICPNDVKNKITSKTKAIMVVDYAGVPVDIKAFQAMEREFGVPVIQDSAHAFGASFNNLKLGSHFKYTTFSFQAIKHMTTIDGGLIILNNTEDYEKAKLMRWFGLDKKLARKENDIKFQGYKYHMNNVNAMVGLVQMDFIEPIIETYIQNGRYFDDNLKELPGVSLLKYYYGSIPSYWLYTLKVERKSDFIMKMLEKGIMASDLHKRNDTHTIFNESKALLPNVDTFEKVWVHIPCGWWVTEKDREYIVKSIKEGW